MFQVCGVVGCAELLSAFCFMSSLLLYCRAPTEVHIQKENHVYSKCSKTTQIKLEKTGKKLLL